MWPQPFLLRRLRRSAAKTHVGRPVGQARISASRVTFRCMHNLKYPGHRRLSGAFVLALLAGSEAVRLQEQPPPQQLRTDFIMDSCTQLSHNAISRELRVLGMTSLVVERLFTSARL